MKSRGLFNRGAGLLGLASLLVFSLASVPAQAKSCPPQANCGVRITGTIWGSFNGQHWSGSALVQIGDSQPMFAEMVDEATKAPEFQADGSFTGAERITFTFTEEDSFQVVVKYCAFPGATANYYTYRLAEPGKIENPTGMFKDMNLTGSVMICGPFVFPFDGEWNMYPAPGWIAQMKGKVRCSPSK